MVAYRMYSCAKWFTSAAVGTRSMRVSRSSNCMIARPRNASIEGPAAFLVRRAARR